MYCFFLLLASNAILWHSGNFWGQLNRLVLVSDLLQLVLSLSYNAKQQQTLSYFFVFMLARSFSKDIVYFKNTSGYPENLKKNIYDCLMMETKQKCKSYLLKGWSNHSHQRFGSLRAFVEAETGNCLKLPHRPLC